MTEHMVQKDRDRKRVSIPVFVLYNKNNNLTTRRDKNGRGNYKTREVDHTYL